ELAPTQPQTGSWRTAVEVDPLGVPLEDRIAHLLRVDDALRGPQVVVRQSFVRARREQRLFVSSEGAALEQEVVESGGGIDVTASDGTLTQQRGFPSAFGGSSQQGGWEIVERLGLVEEAPRVAEQAAALLRAEPCPAKRTTIVIDADQAVLQLHESVGHPTELDRVLGFEASYAGTSFLHPGDLGSLRYGSELMNVTADPTTPGALGSFGFDDEGVPAEPLAIVREGR